MAALTRHPFGTTRDGSVVERLTLETTSGLTASLLSYGATLQELWQPDAAGARRNVALGFATLEGYTGRPDHYFGATIGRFANRIGGAGFTLDGRRYELPRNDGDHNLHGGPHGFDRCVWRIAEASAQPDRARVVFAYTSADGEMGFPGQVEVTVSYTLDEGHELRIDYHAESLAPTVVNLTNHTLWNLAGEGSGTVEDHWLTLAADAYTPTDATLIPTGTIAPVSGTALDFTRPARLGARLGALELSRPGGYDHNFVLRTRDDGTPQFAARLDEPVSGRSLEIHTTEPGFQLYSGNLLDGSLTGLSGRAYPRHGGIAIETQHFPDSPNQARFPSTVVRPGTPFVSTSVYRFTLADDGATPHRTTARASAGVDEAADA